VDLDILPDPNAVANRAADIIAAKAREAFAQRGNFTMAVSGGKTPGLMLRVLSGKDVPWSAVHLFQVDERIAPTGHPDRNLTHIYESLLDHVPIRPEQIHAMPVEADDLQAAADQYAKALQQFAGQPPVLDLVHLGMGPDGHTASLVPGDPVLNVKDKDVAVTAEYQGRKRMTLTYPLLNRSRNILWVITGADKSAMLQRLKTADPAIPAGRIAQRSAIVLVDAAAAAKS
jgi:6-phosphogluconolactonase